MCARGPSCLYSFSLLRLVGDRPAAFDHLHFIWKEAGPVALEECQGHLTVAEGTSQEAVPGVPVTAVTKAELAVLEPRLTAISPALRPAPHPPATSRGHIFVLVQEARHDMATDVCVYVTVRFHDPREPGAILCCLSFYRERSQQQKMCTNDLIFFFSPKEKPACPVSDPASLLARAGSLLLTL